MSGGPPEWFGLTPDEVTALRRMHAEAPEAALSLEIADFSLGTTRTRARMEQPPRRRWWQLKAKPQPATSQDVAIPAVTVSLPPGGLLDFADPVTGFPGLDQSPLPERTLTVWSDSVLSIQHGDAWRFVIVGTDPFDQTWLDLAFPAATAHFHPVVAVVAVVFGPIPPEGAIQPSRLDTMPLTLVHLQDRRQEHQS